MCRYGGENAEMHMQKPENALFPSQEEGTQLL